MSLRLKLAALGVALVAAASAAPALAHSVTVGALSLTDLWTRATPPGAPSAAGYLTITNTGKEPDRLLSATSGAAAKGELHLMAVKDGIMTMQPVDGGIAVPAGGGVTLAPSGLHIMFITLKDGLKEGGQMPVTLTFEKAGKVDTFLHVLAVGAKGPGDAAPHDMNNMKTDAPK
ncbi:copper chaperone PCu(A)C [soil metagenome]